jgi:hypothetical protein
LNITDRIEAFIRLGNDLKDGLDNSPWISQAATEAEQLNPWFTSVNISFALKEISRLLEPSRLKNWLAKYPGIDFDPGTPREIGVVLAGNIPLVGFHDFLCVLLSGNRFKGKLSGKDNKLLPCVAERLIHHLPELDEHISFVEDKIGNIDAIIATGSDNTSRYFQYYFGKYPHIFRNNRSGVAILSGKESPDDLAMLADDIFIYFGLGCRNVSKLFIPRDYDFENFYNAMEKYEHLSRHHKYTNNYQYYRSVYLMNRVEHLDNGFLILKEDKSYSSPVSIIYYDQYSNPSDLKQEIESNQEKIQCLLAPAGMDLPVLPYGKSQHPELWEYADNIDTLIFLSNLYKN